MEPFEFHGELFELRTALLEALSEQGFVWHADFGAIDLQHDVFGLEVTAIQTEAAAIAIEQVVRKLLPDWRHTRTFYEDYNVGELGWKVMISRNPEIYDHSEAPLKIQSPLPSRLVSTLVGQVTRLFKKVFWGNETRH